MPNLQLRPYQLDLLSRAEAEFARGHGAVMLSLATGAGKTGIAASWAGQFKGRVLFIAPKLAVIGQAPGEFKKWGEHAIAVGSGMRSWESATKPNIFGNPVIACSPQTAFNRLFSKQTGKPFQGYGGFGQFDAVIIDEAHHAPDTPKQVSEIIAAAKKLGKPVLGITATPWRLSKREGFAPLWDVLNIGPEWIDLRGEYLAEVDVINSRQTIIGAGAYSGQDYKEGETIKANARNPIFTSGVFDYLDMHGRRPDGTYKKTIIFAVGQKHALNQVKAARERGIETGLLVSSPDILDAAPRGVEINRARVNERLRDDSLRVVINVNIVTEGYDLPDVECVIVSRPTMSVALWKQMCGRGSRLSPGKDRLTLIDLTDNTLRLGDPFRRYNWKLGARGDDMLAGDPVMRSCKPQDAEGCERMLFTAERACPGCGEAQGQDCDTCGKHRLWDDYKRSSTRCERCVAAEPSHPLFEPQGFGTWSNRYYEVTQVRLRKTKYGVWFVECKLRDGRKANYFNADRALALAADLPELKRGGWVMLDDRLTVMVALRENRRWLNVSDMIARTKRLARTDNHARKTPPSFEVGDKVTWLKGSGVYEVFTLYPDNQEARLLNPNKRGFTYAKFADLKHAVSQPA